MNLMWLYNLPNWLFTMLLVGISTSIGLAGLYLTRRWVARIHSEHSHNEIVSYYLAAAAVFYGIALGLIAVATWQAFSSTAAKVESEAASLAALYRDVTCYPEPLRSELRGELKEYTQYVIEKAWPLQRNGIIPEDGTIRLNKVQASLVNFEPKAEREKIAAAEAQHAFNHMVELRRMRLMSVESGLPTSVWTVVVLGAIATLAITWFFQTRSFKVHFWMTVIFSALIGLIIQLLAAMDHPYLGDFSINPKAFQVAYDQLMR
jgi:hypothetical protein